MKTITGIIISILFIILVILFRSGDQNIAPVENNVWPTPVPASPTDTNSAIAPNDAKVPKSAEDLKTERMTTAYKILEKKREKLKRLLARLRHDMWNLKFAPETAKEINDILLNAHKLIRNPDMLGAFHNENEINNEIAKVAFADKSLHRVTELIQENKEKGIK